MNIFYSYCLDDIFHKWLDNFDHDLKFIFENPSKTFNSLENNLVFDIYDSYSTHSTRTSCHKPHTKNNILLSLAKRIVSIVTNNREKQIKELK